MAGIVYLVGAGPGDPGLITMRGLECIRTADVLVYDRLVSPALVAQARPGAELLYAGKEVGQHGRKQAEINRLLAARAERGLAVCRLKGGDPFVFGRGGEEADLLAELGLEFEVVPGVTAGVAAPAFAGIPVTHRDYAGSLSLVTGHDGLCKQGPAVAWDRLARGSETLLIYMGVSGLAEVAGRLVAAGRPAGTPVAVVRWGSTAEQQTVTGTLATIADAVRQAGLTAPALAVVGEVVALRERLNWAELRPLFGHRTLVPGVTGAAPAAPAITAVLKRAGAEVWDWPVALPKRRSPGLTPRADTAPLLREAVAGGRIQSVLFAAPALVGATVAALGGPEPLRGRHILCRDAATAAAAKRAGLAVSAVTHTGAEALTALLPGCRLVAVG